METTAFRWAKLLPLSVFIAQEHYAIWCDSRVSVRGSYAWEIASPTEWLYTMVELAKKLVHNITNRSSIPALKPIMGHLHEVQPEWKLAFVILLMFAWTSSAGRI